MKYMRLSHKPTGCGEHIVHIDGAQAPVALALIDQAKRDHRFESCCDHHLEALVNQGLLSFLL